MYRKFLYGFIFLIAGLTSCQKYLDVNTDPTRSLTSSPELALPAAQVYLATGIGGDIASMMSVWCQYWTTKPGTAVNIWDKNNANTSDGNALFSRFMRGGSNLTYIINKTDQPIFQGIAKILLAYQTQICVDLFGNIPYSEAFKGDINDGGITSPKYDNAEEIYSNLIQLLDEGIELLHSTGAGIRNPGTTDLIYGGDVELWEAFANSVKLKVYMRQFNVADASLIAEMQAFIEETEANEFFILYPSDIAKVEFSSTASNTNPLWNRNKSSIGLSYVASKTLIDYLKADPNDLRIDKFYDKNKTGIHVGMKQGNVEQEPNDASFSSPEGALKSDGGEYIFGPQIPVILISPWEVKFLLAEAAARGFNLSYTDEDYYYSAIEDNFNYFGLSSSDAANYYSGSVGSYNSSDLTSKIKSIALQKWISFNGTQSVESWIETRRLDNVSNPIFSTLPGGVFVVPTKNDLGGNIFPSILFYPSQEESYNTSFPGQHPITNKVFWDN